MAQRISRLFRTIFLVEILRGLGLTLRHLFARPVTLQYPHQKPEVSRRYRGVMSLLRYQDGTEKCVGCGLCEAVCPSNVIKVVSAEQEDTPMKRYAREYWFDLSRCVFCGFCVEACPVDALAMTPNYEYSTVNKRELMLSKETLLGLGDRYFPKQPPKPAFVGSCESDLYLLTVQRKGYPLKGTEHQTPPSEPAISVKPGPSASEQSAP
ncbi:MAG: NADH-quinone oxidoreductase subunit NuoI [Nitrospirota bacterium]